MAAAQTGPLYLELYLRYFERPARPVLGPPLFSPHPARLRRSLLHHRRLGLKESPHVPDASRARSPPAPPASRPRSGPRPPRAHDGGGHSIPPEVQRVLGGRAGYGLPHVVPPHLLRGATEPGFPPPRHHHPPPAAPLRALRVTPTPSARPRTASTRTLARSTRARSARRTCPTPRTSPRSSLAARRRARCWTRSTRRRSRTTTGPPSAPPRSIRSWPWRRWVARDGHRAAGAPAAAASRRRALGPRPHPTPCPLVHPTLAVRRRRPLVAVDSVQLTPPAVPARPRTRSSART